LPVRDFEISPVLAGESEVGRIWLASCQPVRDDADEVIGLNIVVQDITDRKRTETALRAARESVSQRDAFLHAVADRLPRAFVYRVIHSPDGSFVFTYLSKGVEAVAGLTAEDLFREPTLLTERIIDEDRQPFIDAMTKSLTDFTPFDFACRLRWADGSVHWNHFRSAVRPLDDGTFACEGLMLDVTAQKHAEEALLDSQARNDAILSAIPDIMFLQTLDGIYLDAHVGDPRLLLVPKDIFLGRSMHEVLPPHMAEAFSACFRRVAAEGSAVHEYPLELSGEERPFRFRPTRTQEEVSGRMLADVVERVFQGSRELLLVQLLKQKKLTVKERLVLQEILKEHQS
jgi:PAS domain-containing protein